MRIESAVIAFTLVAPTWADTLPIREVTAFKDGHVMVLREGTAPVDNDGRVILDELPQPIMGAFWPYSADAGATLKAVTSGVRDITEQVETANLPQIIEANIGQDVELRVTQVGTVRGVIKDVLGPAGQNVAVVETDEGTRVFHIGNIFDIRVPEGGVRTSMDIAFEQPYLEMDLDWDAAPSSAADVGVMYVQKGLRWIPGYRITLDGDGRAKVELQATLVNELADLMDVTANLVVGVPQFTFKDTLDPMALQHAVAPLGQYFQSNSRSANALSNAILTQSRMGERRVPVQAPPSGSAQGPEFTGGEHAEDLFVFTISGVSLAMGQRMVVPVTSFELRYEDVYKLDVPIEPLAPFWSRFNAKQRREIAQLMERPNVRHAVRLENTSHVPITTAPALLMLGDRVLAQSMTTYAATGAHVDLEITDAVDILVESEEAEVERSINAMAFGSDKYHLNRMIGGLTLTSHRREPVRIEVSRFVLGNLDEVSEGVTHTAMSIFSSRAFMSTPRGGWWHWHEWPWWWMRVNGPQRLEWNVTLEPGEPESIEWSWHYYWR